MKKQMLNEINRIQELMGVDNKKMLINENTGQIIRKIWNLADDFLTTVPKKAGAVADEIQIGTVTVSRAFWRNIEDVLADPELIGALSKAELKTLGKVLSQSPELVTKTYKEIIQEFLEKTPGATERELFEAMTTEMNAGKTLNEVLLEMTGGDELATSMLTKKFSQRQMDFDTGKFVIEVNPKPKVATKTLLSADEIKAFNKVIEAKSVKTFFMDFAQLWKKDLDTLKQEIVELSNGFISQLEGKSAEEIQELLNAYSVAVSRKLDLVEIKMNGAAADVLENYGVSPQIVNKIKTGEEPFIKVFRDARAADSQSLGRVILDTSKEFFTEVGDLFKGIFRREGNTILRAFNPKTSIGQWFYTNQWASLNKLYRLAIKMSPGQAKTNLIKFVAATMFASSVGFVFGQFIKSTLTGLWKVYGYGAYNKILDFVEYLWNAVPGQEIDLEDKKMELPGDEYDWDDFLGVFSVPIDAIAQEIHADVLDGYEKNGMKDVLLRLFPGGILTYPESMASQFIETITPGLERVPNLRNGILNMLGIDPAESDKAIKDALEQNGVTTNDFPQELIDVFPPSKLGELKNEDGVISRGELKMAESTGQYYWGDEEYIIAESNEGVWKVYNPSNMSWYDITPDW